MELAGFVAPDAPDPGDDIRAQVAEVGITVAGLVAQTHLEDMGELGISSSTSWQEDPETGVLEQASIARTYVLWRHPEDRTDPRNLAELDDRLRAELDTPPARSLPTWLLDARERMRYPHLWEAVQTHWTAQTSDRPTAAERLRSHAEYILTNRFRAELGLVSLQDRAPRIPPAALQPWDVVVDGVPRSGLLLDTDPFVLGLAVDLDDGRVVTVVVDRDLLPLLRLELASDLPLR